ncbi:hypothetical protein PSTT_05018 [Puccinia striiformis]|uniref:Uncharacterized protein n=1 Tax=Puccinia striiformis TaxID=27350 RepID=A0A2S4VQB6_9BASI|nr:hypothetical protein PSTT_05018 [Puccinia striiformis]
MDTEYHYQIETTATPRSSQDSPRLRRMRFIQSGHLPPSEKFEMSGPCLHRYEMCRLACEESSDWIMVDPWEARQAEYVEQLRLGL